MKNNSIAVIIPIHNSWSHTKRTVESLLNQDYDNYTLIIVDDGSTDETISQLPLLLNSPHRIIKGDGNWFWTKSVNKGINYALKLNVDYMLLLNNDVVFNKNFLSKLIENAASLGNNIFSPTIKYLDIAGQYFGGKLSKIIGVKRIRYDEVISYKVDENILSVDELTGMSLLIPRSVIDKIGLFDEENFPQYLSDSEFTLRACAAGIKNYVLMNCSIGAYMLHSGHRQKKITLPILINQIFDKKSSQSIKSNYILYSKYVKFPFLIVFIRALKNFFNLLFRMIFGNNISRRLKHYFQK